MFDSIDFLKPAWLLVAAITLVGCDNSDQTATKEPVLRPAKIFEVGQDTQSEFRNFPAEVEANADSKLAFRVSGQIISLPVKAGEDVEQGQVLAQLDPKDFKLRLDDRKARFDLAKSQFERAKSMLDKKLIAQSQYDESQANLRVAQSSLDTAQTELDYTYLRAPFSGSVAQKNAENHENIQAKQTIFTLQTSDRIDISIQVPENIFAHIKKRAQYEPTVTFASYPKRQFLVKIKEWDSVADPSTLSYKVVFSMAAPVGINILPGMTANLSADIFKVTDYQKGSFQLPIEAVFSAPDSSANKKTRYIWKLDSTSMKVYRVEVSVGEIKNGTIEVLGGVTKGDHVVAAGVHFLTEGMKVRAWNREEGL